MLRAVAIRTNPKLPRVGFDPDVCLVEPKPADLDAIDSVRLWEHSPPCLTFEAVSRNHPYKDYAIIPEKCAVTGVTELIVFDPLLAGPKSLGGPWLLQLWQRAPDTNFQRVYAGNGSVRSAVLDAYLIPNASERRLGIADCPDGSSPWLTAEQRLQQREEQARQREEQARQRVLELEAELAKRGGSTQRGA